MTRIPLHALVLVAATAALCACQTQRTEPASDAVVLRSYDVPAAFASEISSVVRSVLRPRGDDKVSLGSASVGPGGRLLVAAPEGVQQGVKALVDGLKASKPAAPATITLEAWVVVGRPAPKPVVPASLTEVQPALDALQRAGGASEFFLVEKLMTTGISGVHGRSRGSWVVLDNTATVFDGKIVADVEIDVPGPPQMETRLTTTPGKLVVVGQSGYSPATASTGMPFVEERNAQGLSLYYILRATAALSGP